MNKMKRAITGCALALVLAATTAFAAPPAVCDGTGSGCALGQCQYQEQCEYQGQCQGIGQGQGRGQGHGQGHGMRNGSCR